MKLKISQQEIKFDYFFFSVVIPKNDKIVYSFPNEWTQKTVGIAPAMFILSENRRVHYKIPLISRLVFLLDVLIDYRYQYPTVVGKKVFLWTNGLTKVTSKNVFNIKKSLEKIREALDLLKSYGYNVADAEVELQKLVESEIKESKIYYTFKHRLKLFFILCFVGIVYCSLFFISDNSENKKEVFVLCLGMFTPFLFLGTMALIFARTKLFFMKFLLILVSSLFIIAFIGQIIKWV